MQVGRKAVVQPSRLFASHPGIRFDVRQGSAVVLFAPKGASGTVLQVASDGQECLIELYWNENPRAAPGAGHVWRIWVRREWFGQLFAT